MNKCGLMKAELHVSACGSVECKGDYIRRGACEGRSRFISVKSAWPTDIITIYHHNQNKRSGRRFSEDAHERHWKMARCAWTIPSGRRTFYEASANVRSGRPPLGNWRRDRGANPPPKLLFYEADFEVELEPVVAGVVGCQQETHEDADVDDALEEGVH